MVLILGDEEAEKGKERKVGRARAVLLSDEQSKSWKGQELEEKLPGWGQVGRKRPGTGGNWGGQKRGPRGARRPRQKAESPLLTLAAVWRLPHCVQ